MFKTVDTQVEQEKIVQKQIILLRRPQGRQRI